MGKTISEINQPYSKCLRMLFVAIFITKTVLKYNTIHKYYLVLRSSNFKSKFQN